MGRIYSVETSGITLAELRDLVEIQAGTDNPIHVHGWFLFQTSDVGDAAEEILRLETVRGIGTVTSGSGGTVATPQPRDDGDAATTATVEVNNTTRLAVGTGSLETLEQYGWNVRIPWLHLYTPELRPRINPEDFWTLGLPAAPADALTFGATYWFEEL